MHNTGLGDYILMSGAVRHLLSSYEEVHLVVVLRNLKNVSFLYRDEPRIVIIEARNPQSAHHGQLMARTYAKKYREEGNDALVFFWARMNHWTGHIKAMGLDPSNNNWCEAFYKGLNISYSERYNSFYIKRDLEQEELVYERVVDNFGPNYSFVVDTTKRGVRAICISDDENTVNPRYCKVPTLLFDWMTVIERASMIHTVDTSYMHLIKQMRLKDKDQLKFFHRYARDCPGTNGDYINDNWDDGWIDLKDKGQIVCLEE